MKKAIFIVILAGMLVWAVYDYIDSGDDNSKSGKNTSSEGYEIGLEIGNMAPDFQLQNLKGEDVALSDFRGSRVIVNFWATWCPPCRAEMPDMEKLHQNKDIVILAVNLTVSENSVDEVRKFVDKFELTFPVLLDEQKEVAEDYSIQPIPTSFMIDSNGIIQYKAFGAMNYDLMVQEFEKMD